MTKVLAAVTAAAVLVLGFAVLDSQAQKQQHRHGIAVKAFSKQIKLPKRSDEATAGVAGVTAFCPDGYRAVGGGHDSDRIAYVPVSKLRFGAYSAIAINQIDKAGVLEVEVGCVPTKTRLSAASASRSRAELRRDVERFRDQVRGH
jgi:hypothetical protein